MSKSSTEEKEPMNPEALHPEICKFVVNFKLEGTQCYFLNNFFIVMGKTTAALPDHLKLISGVFVCTVDSNILLKHGDFSANENEVREKIREYDLIGDSLLILTSTLNQSLNTIEHNSVRPFLKSDINDISFVQHWPLD